LRGNKVFSTLEQCRRTSACKLCCFSKKKNDKGIKAWVVMSANEGEDVSNFQEGTCRKTGGKAKKGTGQKKARGKGTRITKMGGVATGPWEKGGRGEGA